MIENSQSSNQTLNSQSNPSHTRDTEFSLTLGDESVIVSPYGASLRRYFKTTSHGEWNLIWGYHGGANKMGGQGDVLIPFPGRIKGGIFALSGEVYNLEKNDKDGPNAIHGFLRATLFDVKSVSKTHASFGYKISEKDFASKGYPFSLDIEVTYELSNSGLTTKYQIKNVGTKAAPVGAGFHPYFCADQGELKDWNIRIPANKYIELEKLVPTGRILPVKATHLDFTSGRLVGDQTYNDCLANLDRNSVGLIEISVQARNSDQKIVLTLDKSFEYVVIYTGDQIPAPHMRQGFAIEPMTCAPDAFNHEGWGTKVLATGESLAGQYSISARI